MQAAVEQLVRETMQWSPVDQMRLETVIAALTQARQTPTHPERVTLIVDAQERLTKLMGTLVWRQF